jgi:hypothetical protein
MKYTVVSADFVLDPKINPTMRLDAEFMTKLMTCFNCKHQLYYDPSTKSLHHYTRAFHSHGYPYSNKKCYYGKQGEHCGCMNPELSDPNN